MQIIRSTIIVGLVFIYLASTAGAQVFDPVVMKANAVRNSKYCSLGRWPAKGTFSSARTEPVFVKRGDLAASYDNAIPPATKLYWLNVNALRRGKIPELKSFFMTMVNQNHFTKVSSFQPDSYYGGKVPADIAKFYRQKSNLYIETSYLAGMYLVAAAQSYSIIEPYLSAQETDAAKKWGRLLFNDIVRHGTIQRAKDISSSLAAGFTTWGSVTGDSKIISKGIFYFNLGIKDITRAGLERQFIQGYQKEIELKYFHMTYGHLAIAAWAIEKNGGRAFSKKLGGGSLIDAFNYFLNASFYPEKRRGISRNQKLTAYTKNARNIYWAMGYLEYLKDSGLSDAQIPLLSRSLAIGRRGGGFYTTFFGGFSSCFLAG